MIISDNNSTGPQEECNMTGGGGGHAHGSAPEAGSMFRLTLVRHGQTNHNRLCLLQGQMDTQLNDFGREQAGLLARYLRRMGIRYDQVYSSDLSRAYETATIICTSDPKRHSNSIKLEALLRERSYGKLQGLPMATVRKIAASGPTSNSSSSSLANATKESSLDSDIINSNPVTLWKPASRIHRPEGGETLEEVRARLELFFERVLLANVSNQQHILVVSHGGTIREFLKIFKYKYEAPIKYQELLMTPNTGVNELDIWLNSDKQVVQIRPNYLHELPHLTFDVWNRDNPHVNLNNLHLRTPTEFNEKHKKKDLNDHQISSSQMLAFTPPAAAAAAAAAAAVVAAMPPATSNTTNSTTTTAH